MHFNLRSFEMDVPHFPRNIFLWRFTTDALPPTLNPGLWAHYPLWPTLYPRYLRPHGGEGVGGLDGPKISFIYLERYRWNAQYVKTAWKIFFLVWVIIFWESRFACEYTTRKTFKSWYWKKSQKVHSFGQLIC